MIFKESGYDEFLAKKIQEGLQAADKGEVISSVQLDLEMQALFSKLDRELSQQEAELLENKDVEIITIIHSSRLYPRP